MSKSMYEKYAEEAQPGVLAKTISLEEAAESLKGFKGRFSKEYVEWAEEICAEMFGRTFEEVRDLVDGKAHWISVAGMYEEGSGKTVGSEYMIRGEVYLPYLPFLYEGLEGGETIQFPTKGEMYLIAQLSANPNFHHVSAHYVGEYAAAGGVFEFSFFTQLNKDAIQRVFFEMFFGMKHSFYLDHNLDAKLANAVERSGETVKDIHFKNEIEKD